ncbi:hypothetical protein DPMN_129311, partial [Dreissena polymorpha]
FNYPGNTQCLSSTCLCSTTQFNYPGNTQCLSSTTHLQMMIKSFFGSSDPGNTQCLSSTFNYPGNTVLEFNYPGNTQCLSSTFNYPGNTHCFRSTTQTQTQFNYPGNTQCLSSTTQFNYPGNTQCLSSTTQFNYPGNTQCLSSTFNYPGNTLCSSSTTQLSGNMHDLPGLCFETQKKTVAVVMVSGGYPDKYKKGLPITGLDQAQNLGLTVFQAGTTLAEAGLVTSGGRVLAVVATESDFETATSVAQKGAAMIKFEGAFHRKDIGLRVVSRNLHTPPLSYKDSGVDIVVGDKLVEAIKPLAESSSRPGCMAGLGMFGSLFDLKAAGFQDPILVSGTDGVGTKLKIAKAVGNHKTIGIDLVAMCVNDILAHGAEPLYFLDYFATGHLNVAQAKEVIAGITDGCRMSGCALVGGETAEMPGMYQPGDYDLAGFAVGAVERNKILPRVQDIAEGDSVIGLGSSGLHSNGFSLVRKLVEKLELQYDKPSPFKSGKSLGEDLLTPTKIYVSSVLPLMKNGDVKAFAHITGGGLVENIPRVMPEGLGVKLDATSWHMHSVFGWLAEKGNIADSEMARTFNCGVGAVLIVDAALAGPITEKLLENGEAASVIGHVVKQIGERCVVIDKLQSALIQSWRHIPGVSRKKRVGVLISGSGTNMQALIDFTRDPLNFSAAEIVLVISNKTGVEGLVRAEKAGIASKVISHTGYSSREEFDEALHQSLEAAGVEIVCLAGFMRILSGGFVQKWTGRMLNIHPSLLPSFKGSDAHKQVLKAGVRISGCTVHFVTEEVDEGAILLQESVPVYHDDTESRLSERVKQQEHKAFPRALELVASEQVKLGASGKVEWCV